MMAVTKFSIIKIGTHRGTSPYYKFWGQVPTHKLQLYPFLSKTSVVTDFSSCDLSENNQTEGEVGSTFPLKLRSAHTRGQVPAFVKSVFTNGIVRVIRHKLIN